mgnify:CR=1 FL=1
MSDRDVYGLSLVAKSSFRHLALASGLHAFVSYGVSAFYNSYLIRSHGFTVAEAGVSLAFIVGIGAHLPRLDNPEDAVAAVPADAPRLVFMHHPASFERIPAGQAPLDLAGHTHGGQICLPTPRGKLRLVHLGARHWEGVDETPAGTLHVSRGLGTSFVPFRFLARPEATKLTLRCPSGSIQ